MGVTMMIRTGLFSMLAMYSFYVVMLVWLAVSAINHKDARIAYLVAILGFSSFGVAYTVGIIKKRKRTN